MTVYRFSVGGLLYSYIKIKDVIHGEKQKTIPQLEAEKAENERKISQLQHKKQQLENRITYYEKGDRRKRAHHLITVAQPLKASHR